MPRFPEFNAAAVAAANTPDSFGMRREIIDLSIARSAELKNLFIWQQQGLHIRNAADENVGGVQISLDITGNPANMPDANIYLSAGDSLSDIPYAQVTIGNKAQPGKFAYLESSTKATLHPQQLTGAADVEGDVNVREKGTASGVTLSDVQGEYDGAFKKSDFMFASDESYASGNREWLKNLKQGAKINPTGNVFWANYNTGFNQLSVSSGTNANYFQVYLTAAQTGTIMGGNVGYDAFYKLKFFFGYRDQTSSLIEVVDSGLFFGGGGFGEVRPRKQIISAVRTAGVITVSNSIIEYPVVVVPANRTNDMVLEFILSPANAVSIDVDFDVGCQWQRVQRYPT